MKTQSALALLAIPLLSGCAFEYGQTHLNSNYVYARSDVTPLTNVSETGSNTKIAFNCGYTESEYQELYDAAISKSDGANVLIDYTIQYKTIIYPVVPLCRTDATLSGVAARMNVK